jgi:uroporphyrinogen decarboxylase
MNVSPFNRLVTSSVRRPSMPIATYPGMALTGAIVRDVVTTPHAQFAIQEALHGRYQTPFVLSAMDLSVEADAFGCAVQLSDHEVPAIPGRLVTDQAAADRLPVPEPGDGRTGVYLEAVRLLRRLPDRPLVLGGCIGPFSLAARIVGVRESMELTVLDPTLMHTVIEKSARFLATYVRAFSDAGADGVIMAEPAAGLLSPRSLTTFSSDYIRGIAAAVDPERFALILHNCAAKIVHLPAILTTGLTCYHFGAPMDIPAALEKVPPEVILCGNLDPAGVFCQLAPAEVTVRAASLLAATGSHRNFVLSSGCDLPPNSQLASLDAFYAAVDAAGPR